MMSSARIWKRSSLDVGHLIRPRGTDPGRRRVTLEEGHGDADWALISTSSIGLPAVADASDLNGDFVSLIEEHTVVAAAQTETGEGRPELFHFTRTAGQVAIDTVEDLHRG